MSYNNITGGRKLSAEEQLQELEVMEFERKLSYRETEESLSIQQEDLEDQYNSTQDQIEAKMEKIKKIEEQYKELDKAHLQEISVKVLTNPFTLTHSVHILFLLNKSLC